MISSPADDKEETAPITTAGHQEATGPNDAAAAAVGAGQSIILFYKYHPLSPERSVTEIYRTHLESLCRALNLVGRILVGCSRTEGINGTLAGAHDNVRAFTSALLRRGGDDNDHDDDKKSHKVCVNATEASSAARRRQVAVDCFCKESKLFFESIGEPDLKMNSSDDFKWSYSSSSNTASAADTCDALFPDLNVKLVKELIGTGGVLSSISLEETAKGYLTPHEWRDELLSLSSRTRNLANNNTNNGNDNQTSSSNNNNNSNDDDTVLIDCRNTKEYQIGRFTGAQGTDIIARFVHWASFNSHIVQIICGQKLNTFVFFFFFGSGFARRSRTWYD